jgi:T5SS/PEP-CTERM-associated repeat protein
VIRVRRWRVFSPLAAVRFVTLAVALAPATRAQYTNTYQTNAISAVTSNWVGTYNVNGWYNQLRIISGGVLISGGGGIGNAPNNFVFSNNSAIVSGTGSLWQCSGGQANDLVVGGGAGAGGVGTVNSLVVSNGGRVINVSGYVGRGSSATPPSTFNRALVSDPGSVWSNSAFLRVGYFGDGNSLIISNGGTVLSWYSYVGLLGSSNSVLVTGNGSAWTNSNSITVGLGNPCSGNSLVIRDGGIVVSSGISLGAAGSVSNLLVISDGGSLSMSSNAWLQVVAGTFVLSGGTVTADGVAAGWGADGVVFNKGALSARVVTISNSVPFTVGDNTNAATLHLGGGASEFFDGLIISSNATLTGCGTITGTIVNYGTVINDCPGGALTVFGSVTNFGTVTVASGGLLSFGYPVVNLGTINGIGGSVHFLGGLVNSGTLVLDPSDDSDVDGMPNSYEESHGLDPLNAADSNADTDGDGQSNLHEYLAGTDPTNGASAFRILDVVATNDDVLVTWATAAGKTNALQAAGAGGYYTNDFADIFIVTNTARPTTNYLDAGAATNAPARYYRVRLVP